MTFLKAEEADVKGRIKNIEVSKQKSEYSSLQSMPGALSFAFLLYSES